jgi:hypothetical protein
MYTVGRLLQLVALIIPPLAMFSELNKIEPDPGQMLKFLCMAVGIFLLGYLMQRYSGGGPV